jgi:nitroimidazol reductase NimA-like FMN-containing flavoprotein (pyridoxamine 5'-phosphate oxidase superfamily)
VNRRELIEYVREQRHGIVATSGPDGEPQAAFLPIAATADGELVFDARPESRKIANLRGDARVAVVIGGADGTTLQCQGVADLLGGQDRLQWTATWCSCGSP